MNNSQRIEEEMASAASEVADSLDHAYPPANELINQLTDLENKRAHVLHMMQMTDRYLDGWINPLQHRLLREFVAVQAAKIGGNSDDLIDEICMRYGIMDAQELKVRHFWEALNFIWHYAEAQS